MAVIFLTAAALLMLRPLFGGLSHVSGLIIASDAQITLSAIFRPSALALTIGVTIFWLAITCIAGRIYCSTVCPIGTLQALVIKLRRRVDKGMRPYRFEPAKKVRYNLLWIYLATLVVAQPTFAFIIEPWNIWRNMFSIGIPEDLALSWPTIGASLIVGIIFGVISLIAIPLLAWRDGRLFCNAVCPVGTVLGWAGQLGRVQIAIDPDRCISCLKCEDICQSKCIKVVSRYVDNSRCVRCLDCIAVCPTDSKAIGFTTTRTRPAAPLLNKVAGSR